MLLNKKAYYVKRCGNGAAEGAKGQVSWSLHNGPKEAWEVAKKKAHYE